jgi:hypothetical protein
VRHMLCLVIPVFQRVEDMTPTPSFCPPQRQIATRTAPGPGYGDKSHLIMVQHVQL